LKPLSEKEPQENLTMKQLFETIEKDQRGATKFGQYIEDVLEELKEDGFWRGHDISWEFGRIFLIKFLQRVLGEKK